jgi:hypothetical protein
MPDALSLSDYPNMDLADVGLMPNLGYGTVEGVRAHCIVGGSTALLTSAVTSDQTTIEVEDASRFPSAPFTVQVASERMRVTGASGATFTVTRGYGGTEASGHAAGRTVFEVRTEYVYLVSTETIKNINRVYVDGVRRDSGLTAYTGKSGDEHLDWPGKAVVAFSAEAYIGKQVNNSGDTRELEAAISMASHRDLKDETTVGVPLGGKRNQKLWVLFKGSGAVTSQTYEASIKNPGASDAVVVAVVKDNASGTIIRHLRMLVPGSTTRTITVGEECGDWATEFILLPWSTPSALEVQYMKKTVTVVSPPEDEEYEAYSPPVELASCQGSGIEDAPNMKPGGRALAWASYPVTSHGAVVRQTHKAELVNTSETEDAVLRMMAVESDGTLIALNELKIAAGSSETVSLSHSGGGWDAMTRLALVSGEVRLFGLSKEVSYIGEGSSVSDALSTSSARVVVGEEIAVDADWAEDETGEYGGVGTLIERPDHVIRHFVVERMGFSPWDINLASFSAAGGSYASAVTNGYRFGLVINGEITPSEFLRELALQCRSTVKYLKGKWRLDFIPDGAPDAVRTITKDELAGEGAMFTFRKTPVVDIGNRLTATFGKVYTKGANASGWGGAVEKEDAASRAKYGTYPQEFEFPAIRDADTADDVLEHMLLERKTPLLIVEFPVFWEHFDLSVGDTIEIDNPLYGGRKFYIEKVTRLDRFRAEVTAREWWG